MKIVRLLMAVILLLTGIGLAQPGQLSAPASRGFEWAASGSHQARVVRVRHRRRAHKAKRHRAHRAGV